jgi:ATP-binding protein involved in chromosome partitioning
MPVTESDVREALKQVKYPGFNRDIVSFGLVKDIQINNGDVSVQISVTTADPKVPQEIKISAENALKSLPEVSRATVQLTAQQPPQSQTAAQPAHVQNKISGVRYVVAVGSGKGGVGKSTVAVNLACALNKIGMKIGLMDADIYGPSVPKLTGALARPTVSDDEKLIPVENFGLKIMSMASLLDPATPVIWRGPMIMKAIQQFSLSVEWAPLDILLVDLPPGTGDAQLSLAQTIALDGGVIVTTPQDVALEVARRGIAMFEKVNVRILGIIENMSYYECPKCHHRDDIFSHGGGRREAERLEVPFLGEIPLVSAIRDFGDKGRPIVEAAPDSPASKAFVRAAETLVGILNQ